jgi:phosphoglycolate phosphatase-like HAD superfamily hydrolase
MMPHYWRLLVAVLYAVALQEAHLSGVPIAYAAQSGANRQAAKTYSVDFVKSLQHELKRSGYNPGVADGKMGPSTRQALKRFQAAHGLSTTGAPDIPTLTKLLGQSLSQ